MTESKKQNEKFDELLTQKEFCALLKISDATAESWRFYGRGPAFIRLSPRCIRYKKSDVFQWLSDSQVVPTV